MQDVMDDTSFKALTISRQDVKIAKWTVHNHFVSWLEVQQEVKDALKKHSRALVHMEFRLRYRCLHTWLGHERLQARLRNLNQRVNVSDDRRVLDISFGVWLTVQVHVLKSLMLFRLVDDAFLRSLLTRLFGRAATVTWLCGAFQVDRGFWTLSSSPCQLPNLLQREVSAEEAARAPESPHRKYRGQTDQSTF